MKIIFENGMYAAVADTKDKVISFENGYSYKLYRKTNKFTDCTEIDTPIEEYTEATEQDYIDALGEMGVNFNG